MAQAFIWDGVINDTAVLQREKQWYKKVYFTAFGWESKFPWQEATEYNMMFRRKLNTIYSTGNALGFTGDLNDNSKKLNYSFIKYQEEFIKMDEHFKVARQISPIEKDFVPELTRIDLQQLIEAEINFRRKKILDTIQKPNAVDTIVVTPSTDEDTFLTEFDTIMDEAFKLNMQPADMLCSAKFFRNARKFLKLRVYSDKQVDEFVDTKVNANMITTVEGIRLWFVPKQFEYNADDGTIQLLKLLEDDVECIVFESGSTQFPLALRYKVHTPLSYGVAPFGIGVGRQGIIEQVKFYGAGIKEPKKIIIARTTIKKVDLANSDSNFKVYLADPIVLTDFTSGVVQLLSTQQQMWNLTLADVDFFQADGETPLVVGNLSFETVNIVVKAKESSTYFIGQKSLYVQIIKGN